MRRWIGLAALMLSAGLLPFASTKTARADDGCDLTPHFTFPDKAYTFTATKLSPNFPLIVQQDPQSRGVDLQVSLKLEPGTVSYGQWDSVPETIKAGTYGQWCKDLGVQGKDLRPGPTCYVSKDQVVYRPKCNYYTQPVTRGIQNMTIFLVPTMTQQNWLMYSNYNQNPVINALYPSTWWDAFVRGGIILPCEVASSAPCINEGTRFLFASPASASGSQLTWPSRLQDAERMDSNGQILQLPFYYGASNGVGGALDYTVIVLLLDNAQRGSMLASETAGAGDARPQYMEWTLSQIQIDFPADFFIAANANILPAEWMGVKETLPATTRDATDNCGIGMTPACNQPSWDSNNPDFSVAMIFSTLCDATQQSCGKGTEGE
jgi:hypothetical protein